ncbi:MAG: hypothetical protein ACWGPN_17135, partial [Gammaproteobacteria bacterium]
MPTRVPKNVAAARALNRFALIAVLGFASMSSTLVRAQWPAYPTPDVPRTADGAVDLDGPVPRTADGHPDLSGLWRVPRGAAADSGADAPPIAGFLDVGANIDGGLPFAPWAAELRADREA